MPMTTIARVSMLCLALGFTGVSAKHSTSTGAATANPHLSAELVPVPGLAPDEVIRIQIEALRHNDDGDRGIEVAFRFASPGNKSNTGPLSRFISMIKGGSYALMLDFREANFEPVEIRDNRARQRVTLTGSKQSVSYWFYLSRQTIEPFVDCWMTDAVVIEPFDGQVT